MKVIIWALNSWEIIMFYEFLICENMDSTNQHYGDHVVLRPLVVFHYMVLWSMKVVDSKSTFTYCYDQLDSSEKQPVVRLCNSRSVTRPNLYCERYLALRYVRLNFFLIFFLIGSPMYDAPRFAKFWNEETWCYSLKDSDRFTIDECPTKLCCWGILLVRGSRFTISNGRHGTILYMF